MLKPLILSSRDVVGGAALAAYRLHQALQGIGVDSKMLVQVKHSDDDTVFGAQPSTFTKLVPKLNKLPLMLYPHRKAVSFSAQWFQIGRAHV